MRVVIASESLGQGDHLRQVVLSMGLECSAGDCVSFADLPFRLTQAPADVVLVAIGLNRVSALSVIQQTSRTCAVVLAVGRSADSQHIVQVLRSGAQEYLVEAQFRDELVAALEKLRRAGTVTFHRGRTVAVIAAAPGTGVTTVAASLAFALAAHYPQRVALAEIGSGVPELALHLNLEPHHTIGDLANEWDRMDATMLRQTLAEHPGGVSILAYKPETLQAEPLKPAAVRQIAVLLSAIFDFAVLDLSHTMNSAALAALELATDVVLVVRLDVPSLRLSRQLIRWLQEQGVETSKLRLVANRYGQRQQIGAKEATKVLGLPIQEWIPDDSATLNRSLNNGLPLVATARRAAITRTFDNLASRLNQCAA